MVINAVCEKKEQAEALAEMEGIGLIFHPDNTMPYVFRNENAVDCKSFLEEPRLLVRNLDEIGFLKGNGYKGDIYADHTLYSCNRASRAMLASLGVFYDSAPLELNFRELKKRGMERSELMIYGRVPMMITAGCVYKNVKGDKCERDMKNGHDITLTDRTDTDFPVICCCRYCCNIILNSVPLSLHAHLDKIRDLCPGSVRLYFTTEDQSETKKTAEFFIRAIMNDDKTEELPYKEYTNGHFMKGTA